MKSKDQKLLHEGSIQLCKDKSFYDMDILGSRDAAKVKDHDIIIIRMVIMTMELATRLYRAVWSRKQEPTSFIYLAAASNCDHMLDRFTHKLLGLFLLCTERHYAH